MVNLEEVRRKAKERLAPYCKVCPECDGRACKGQVPGVGGAGTGSSFISNLEDLKAVKLNMRTIHDCKPVTRIEIFGQKLEIPVLGAPIAGMYNYQEKMSELDYAVNTVKGFKAAGSISMTGDGISDKEFDSGIKAIIQENGWGIPIMKPWNKEKAIENARRAQEAGAVAVGMDIDGAGLISARLGIPPRTKEELKEIIQSSKLPFILKGIMTVDEAITAVEIGAGAIVVSNHGGRVLDHTPGTAKVLPKIAAAVKGKITILVDGGIRTGIDVLKMIALGADGVLLGRPIAISIFGGGSEGVGLVIDKIKNELIHGMIMTGCNSIKDINKDVIYRD